MPRPSHNEASDISDRVEWIGKTSFFIFTRRFLLIGAPPPLASWFCALVMLDVDVLGRSWRREYWFPGWSRPCWIFRPREPPRREREEAQKRKEDEATREEENADRITLLQTQLTAVHRRVDARYRSFRPKVRSSAFSCLYTPLPYRLSLTWHPPLRHSTTITTSLLLYYMARLRSYSTRTHLIV